MDILYPNYWQGVNDNWDIYYHILNWIWANGKGTVYSVDWLIGNTTQIRISRMEFCIIKVDI